MRTDFVQITQSLFPVEPLSFGLLGDLFPRCDFSKFIFPLWRQLRDQGYVQSKYGALPDTIQDEGLAEHLGRFAPEYRHSHIQSVSRIMAQRGVVHISMRNSMIPRPQFPGDERLVGQDYHSLVDCQP
jgi:hypothetical protein